SRWRWESRSDACQRGRRTTNRRRKPPSPPTPRRCADFAVAAARILRHVDRRRALSVPRDRSARDYTPWSHLLDRLYADHGKAGGDHDRDAADEGEPCAGQRRVGSEDKPQCGLVTALVPQHMELCRDLQQIERDTMRFMGFRGAFDEARPLGEPTN